MKPTQKTIEHLVSLEAHYHYEPENFDCPHREAILCQPEDPIGVAFANLILHYEDLSSYNDCARIVRAIIDTYAPRRSVLDFAGGEA